MKKYILMITMLLTLSVATGCSDRHTINDMKLTKYDSASKLRNFGVAYFSDDKNEEYKFYLYNGDYNMMQIGQKYNITYVTNSMFDADFKIKKFKPSNLKEDKS